MVTTSSFYRLGFVQQADLLQSDGFFLLSRKEGNFIVDLYELHDLMVEVYYREEDEEPVSVMACNTSEKLKTLGSGRLAPRLTIRNPQAGYQKGQYAA